MQRKEELLSQLDNALKRKVQQKYMKESKVVNAPQELGSQFDKNKYQTKQQLSNNNKSPLISHHKQPIFKSQNNINIKASHSPLQSPKLHTQRQANEGAIKSSKVICTVEENSSLQMKMKNQIKRLNARNAVLQKELNQFKYNIAQLEGQSRRLRRDQSEYAKLKQQNASLVKQIEFMRSKSNEGRYKKQAVNISIEQDIKPILIQLNINFLNKNTFPQCMQSISQAVNRLIEEKSKLTAKLNNFDIDSVLIKQSNVALKKQIQVLRKQNEQLQVLIGQDCIKVQELQQTIENQRSEKKQLELRYKQVSKQLQGLKRQHRLIVEGSKHSKPKREQAMVRHNKQNMIQNSAVKTYSDQQAQVEEELGLDSNPSSMPSLPKENAHLHQKISLQTQHIRRLQQKLVNANKDSCSQVEMLEEIVQLRQRIEKEEQRVLQGKIENARQSQTIFKYEEYIKELQYKCEQIQQDISHFMPQLKAIEEENLQLKNQQLYKDQEIINKITTINQFRNQLEQAQQKASTTQLQLNKEIFECRLAKSQIERLQNEIIHLRKKQSDLSIELSRKAAQLNNQLQNSNIHRGERERELVMKMKEYERITVQKAEEIQRMTIQWSIKEKQLILLLNKMQSIKQQNNKLGQNVKKLQKVYIQTRERFALELAQCRQSEQNNRRLVQDYNSKMQDLKQSLNNYESNTNNILSQFSKQEQLFNNTRQQKAKVQNQNQLYTIKNDQLTRQLFGLRCEVQRLSFDSKNNCQLKEYYQQVSNDLKAKLQQLLGQLTRTQGDKAELIDKITLLQNWRHQEQARQTQNQHCLSYKNQECEQLKAQLYKLSQQYHLLSQEYGGFRQEAQRLERERCGQISNLTYDIQRLIRESKQLKLRIEQISSIKQSKHFIQQQNDQRIVVLMEQNRSLLRKNELLLQQVQMKAASRQQDLYLSQLKNKQYCILLKKILAGIVSQQELQSCDSFQILLQMGSERTMVRKKQQRDKQSQLRKQTIQSEYELHQHVSEPIRRIYIGTEISSSQELIYPYTGTDQILQMQSNIKSGGKQSNESPKQFKFSLSPYEQRKEKRTQRLISCFNNRVESKSSLSQNPYE